MRLLHLQQFHHFLCYFSVFHESAKLISTRAICKNGNAYTGMFRPGKFGCDIPCLVVPFIYGHPAGFVVRSHNDQRLFIFGGECQCNSNGLSMSRVSRITPAPDCYGPESNFEPSTIRKNPFAWESRLIAVSVAGTSISPRSGMGALCSSAVKPASFPIYFVYPLFCKGHVAFVPEFLRQITSIFAIFKEHDAPNKNIYFGFQKIGGNIVITAA